MINETTIRNFGFPNILKEMNLKFCFDDELVEEKFVGIDCHCKPDSVKFFLYDNVSGKSIFTMDFHVRKNYSNRAFGGTNINEPHIRLQHIATASSYRKKGIASYYIQKLIEFCISNGIRIITLDVGPSSRDTENALNKDELTVFYKNFSTNEVQIVII